MSLKYHQVKQINKYISTSRNSLISNVLV